jgi:large subunit ribosomal protein L21
MYAIAKSGGKQFKIERNSVIRVPSIQTKVGEKIRLENILLFCEGDTIQVGRPFIDGAYAEARVVGHGRARKIKIIKYKRRKNYHRRIGHRQNFTELVIDNLVIGGKPEEEVVSRAAEEIQAAVETKAEVVEPALAEAPAGEKAETEKKAKPARKARKKPAAEKEDSGSRGIETSAVVKEEKVAGPEAEAESGTGEEAQAPEVKEKEAKIKAKARKPKKVKSESEAQETESGAKAESEEKKSE